MKITFKYIDFGKNKSMAGNTSSTFLNDSAATTFDIWRLDTNHSMPLTPNMTNGTTLVDQSSKEDNTHMVDGIIHVVVPLLILGGTIGNILSLAVFRNTKLRRLSTSCYLTALSLSDTGFLLTMLTLWLEMNNVSVYNQPVLCQLITYVGQVCSFLSPWLVVAFTIERFVATCYPLRRASICTISRARVVVTGLTGIAALFYSYVLVMAGDSYAEVNEPISTIDYDSDNYESGLGSTAASVNATVRYWCGSKPGYLATMNALNWVDFVLTLVMPLVIIIVLNVLISRAVMQFERVRYRMTSLSSNQAAGRDKCLRNNQESDHSEFSSQDSGSANRLYGSNNSMAAAVRLQQPPVDSRYGRGGVTASGICKSAGNQPNVRGRYQIKITKMLLMISSVFLALNTPSYLVRLLGFICGQDCTRSSLFYNAQQWSQLAYYLNFAVNFLLYCASGQNFRKSLRHLVGKALNRVVHARHFSRRNTGNTTLSTNTVTATQNSAHG